MTKRRRDPHAGYTPSRAALNAAESYVESIERADGNLGSGAPVLYVDARDCQDPDHPGEYMICDVCKVDLNRLTNTDDDGIERTQWLHSRNWKKYDHEPVPIAVAERVTESACDFCGVTAQMYWSYLGGRVRVGGGNTISDYGNRWSACQHCGPFIDNGDIEGLLKRTMRVSPNSGEMNAVEKEFAARSYLDLWETFIPTITQRLYTGPKREPARLNPRMMPRLQSGLMKFWHNKKYQKTGGEALRTFTAHIPGVHAGDEDAFWETYPVGRAVPEDVWLNHCNHIAAGVGVADLYWISSNFTRLAIHAGKKFDKIAITYEELPPKTPHAPDDEKRSTFGFMIFEDPIGEIQRPGGVAAVRACTWTLVPGGVWFNLYIQGEEAADADFDVETMRADIGYLLCPNAGVGFEFGQDIELPDSDAVSFMTTILAAWVLLRQPGVAGFSQAPVDKKYARSFQRENKRPLPPVYLVDLRRRPRPKTKPQNATGKEWTEQRLVSGHMKRQFWGPGRAYRKWIFVDDYVAGPEDAPLREPRRKVNVLR